MSRTMTGSSTVGVKLTLVSDDPVTVAADGTIASTDTYAIYGTPVTDWTITNLGLLSGTRKGVTLASGGTVANDASSASIYGKLYGIDIQGAAGQVTNGGTIGSSGTYDAGAGVQLLGGGTVANGATDNTTALISGGQSGAIYINGGTAALVVNNATITGLGDAGTGVQLRAGGTVQNGATDNTAAHISALHNGIGIVGGAGTVTNAGTITGIGSAGFYSYGVYLGSGGTVTNGSPGNSAALIQGGHAAIAVKGAAATVVNGGTIATTTINSSTGIVLSGGGSVTNDAAGTISGAGAGVAISGAAGTVRNAGVIGTTGTDAVTLPSGYANRVIVEPGAAFAGIVDGGNPVVRYQGSGSSVSTLELASGASQGAITGMGSQFTDFGQIAVDSAARWSFSGINFPGFGATLTDDGILLLAGSSELAVFTATIGGNAGNAGTISVTGGSSDFEVGNGGLIVGAGPGQLSVADGGKLQTTSFGIELPGTVDVQGASSHIVIADTLRIDGLLRQGVSTDVGDHYITIIGGNGRAGGDGSFSTSEFITNSGTLFAASGAETVIVPRIVGSGVLEIDAGGDLVLNVGTVDATQTVAFADASGILTIGTLDGFAATIGNFIAGDSIVVQGTSIASTTFDPSAHVLTLFDPSNAVAGSLQFGASVADGSDIIVNGVAPTPCLVMGTPIATERGDVRVEELRIGDRVQVLPGGQSAPVIWLGHRTVDCKRQPEPRNVWPVRVSRHALGPGHPLHDLHLSPDHALLIDGVLIPVKYLINGSTVTQVPRDEVTYFHVELPQHSVLLADGLPVESYLETGGRCNFLDGEGPIALYPDFAVRQWEAEGCAELIVTGPRLTAARQWIDALAQIAANNKVSVRTCRHDTARARTPAASRDRPQSQAETLAAKGVEHCAAVR